MAYGHFANHPPPKTAPNVLLAPFDVQSFGATRPYVPNVKCLGQFAAMDPDEVVSGLALVAGRELQEEEIYVNYRLNPQLRRPVWYAPVDEQEDEMRWA